jgi:hypothetical protein
MVDEAEATQREVPRARSCGDAVPFNWKYPRVPSYAGGAVVALLRAIVQAAVTGKSESGVRSSAERVCRIACLEVGGGSGGVGA